MDIFSRLLSLFPGTKPHENFFTEIVVGILEAYPDILKEWILQVTGDNIEYKSAHIDTRIGWGRLDIHETGSVPDIIIELSSPNNSNSVIVLESKLDSRAGKRQLEKYADHLVDKFPNANGHYLVYITKYYDKKETPYYESQGVIFRQSRWKDFYGLLQKQNSNDPLIKQVMVYMEVIGMAENHTVSPSDISSISELPSSLRFLMDALDEEIKNEFTLVFGMKPKHSDWFRLVTDRQLWLYNETSEWWFGIGFNFHDDENKFPDVQCEIAITDRATRWEEKAKILKKISVSSKNTNHEWQDYELEKSRVWAGILQAKPLIEIVNKDDHLLATKQIFMDYLRQVRGLKKKYPDFLQLKKHRR
jgi:hypothetical protein